MRHPFPYSSEECGIVLGAFSKSETIICNINRPYDTVFTEFHV